MKTKEVIIKGRQVLIAVKVMDGFKEVYNALTGETLCHVVRFEGKGNWFTIGRYGIVSDISVQDPDKNRSLSYWIHVVNKEHEELLELERQEQENIDAMVRYYFGGGECCDDGSCAECRNR